MSNPPPVKQPPFAKLVGITITHVSMQDPAPVGELIAHRKLGGDPLGRDVGDGDADELGKGRLFDGWT